MSPPVPPQVDPADLWDWLVYKGVPEAEATQHVQRYLQSVDPAITQQIKDEAAPNAIESAGLGFSQGGTFGLADEAAGALAGLGAAVIPGGKGYREAYRDQVGETRQATDLAREVHPVATTVGDVAGSVAGGGVQAAKGGLALARNASRLPTIARALARTGIAAGVGGAEAGAHAAGRTDGGARDRASAAVPAAAAGAVLGGGLPVAGRFARQLAEPVVKFAGKVVGRIAGPGAKAAARAKPKPKPKSRVSETAVVDHALKRPRAQQLPIRGEVRASAPPKDIPDIEIPEPAIHQTPSPRAAPDPLDAPTFARRTATPGESPTDPAVMRRALERTPPKPPANSYSTRQMGGKPKASARNRQVSQAEQQVASMTTEQLQQARSLTSGDKRLLNLIERELAKRAQP